MTIVLHVEEEEVERWEHFTSHTQYDLKLDSPELPQLHSGKDLGNLQCIEHDLNHVESHEYENPAKQIVALLGQAISRLLVEPSDFLVQACQDNQNYDRCYTQLNQKECVIELLVHHIQLIAGEDHDNKGDCAVDRGDGDREPFASFVCFAHAFSHGLSLRPVKQGCLDRVDLNRQRANDKQLGHADSPVELLSYLPKDRDLLDVAFVLLCFVHQLILRHNRNDQMSETVLIATVEPHVELIEYSHKAV